MSQMDGRYAKEKPNVWWIIKFENMLPEPSSFMLDERKTEAEMEKIGFHICDAFFRVSRLTFRFLVKM